MARSKKPDGAQRIAAWIDNLNNVEFDKNGIRPFWLPLKVQEQLITRIRRLVAREVKQRDYAWMILIGDIPGYTKVQREFIAHQIKKGTP